MAKSDYVILPLIKSFEIRGYRMFKEDWSYKISSGLNLILGINGIGKTTTTNLLSYALVGTHTGFHEKLTPDYFMNRIIADEAQESENDSIDIVDTFDPKVVLNLTIGDHTVTLIRSLQIDKIEYLEVDKKEINGDKSDLNESYENTIKKLTGLNSLDDLIFLISHLLIREEEHNYLLWKEADQSRVIRLLLNQSGFSDEYAALEKELQDADSKYKREKDFMGKIETRKKALLESRDSEVTSGKTKSKDELEKRIRDFKDERTKTQEEKDVVLLKNETLKTQAKKVENQLSALKTNFDFESDELRALGSKYYHASFADPKGEFIFTKISERNICLVCNNSVTQKRVVEVERKVRQKHECPVCSSPLNNLDDSDQNLSERDVKRMNTLEKSAEQTKVSIRKLQDEFDKLCNQIETNNSALNNFEEAIRKLNLSIAIDQNGLQKFRSSENDFSELDIRIAQLDVEIEDYDKVTKKLLKKFNDIKEEMRKKNEKLNEAIENFNAELVKIFNNLSKPYFGNDCTLIINKKKPSGFELQLSYFIPKMKGKSRNNPTSVSKAESLFLEYLFRFAILKLYLEKSGVKPFLFLETSEGSFDIRNTTIMADTIAQIGKIGFPFIIITNLSKIDFIESLLPDVTERQKRTFNLIEYAPESLIGKKLDKSLTDALKRLKLN